MDAISPAIAKERGIIFSAPMVLALLSGRKRVTRLVLREVPPSPAVENVVHAPKHDRPYLDSYCAARKTTANPRGMTEQWCWWTRDDRPGKTFKVPYVPGSHLFVREAWRTCAGLDDKSPNEIGACHEAGYGRPWGPVEYEADKARRAWTKSDWPTEEAGRLRSPIHMPRWASRITLEVNEVRVERLQDISEEDAWAEGVWNCGERDGGRSLGPAHGRDESLWTHLHGAGSWEANPFVTVIGFSSHPTSGWKPEVVS